MYSQWNAWTLVTFCVGGGWIHGGPGLLRSSSSTDLRAVQDQVRGRYLPKHDCEKSRFAFEIQLHYKACNVCLSPAFRQKTKKWLASFHDLS